MRTDEWMNVRDALHCLPVVVLGGQMREALISHTGKNKEAFNGSKDA